MVEEGGDTVGIVIELWRALTIVANFGEMNVVVMVVGI